MKHLHIPGTAVFDEDNKTKNLPLRSWQSARRDRQQINKWVNKIIADTSKMETQQDMEQGLAHYSSWAKFCFCTVCKVRMVFTFSMTDKTIKRTIFHETWNYMNANFSVHKYRLTRAQSLSLVYVLSMAAFILQQQNWVVVTEIVWLRKLNVFTIWPFMEKVCWTLVWKMMESGYWKGAGLDRAIRGAISKEMTFKLRSEWEGAHHSKFWRRSFRQREQLVQWPSSRNKLMVFEGWTKASRTRARVAWDGDGEGSGPTMGAGTGASFSVAQNVLG